MLLFRGPPRGSLWLTTIPWYQLIKSNAQVEDRTLFLEGVLLFCYSVVLLFCCSVVLFFWAFPPVPPFSIQRLVIARTRCSNTTGMGFAWTWWSEPYIARKVDGVVNVIVLNTEPVFLFLIGG